MGAAPEARLRRSRPFSTVVRDIGPVRSASEPIDDASYQNACQPGPVTGFEPVGELIGGLLHPL